MDLKYLLKKFKPEMDEDVEIQELNYKVGNTSGME
jgi:hypothetical protein